MTIRIDTELHDWLMDHRDAQRRSVSDVIREVIDFWDNCQNDDNPIRRDSKGENNID